MKGLLKNKFGVRRQAERDAAFRSVSKAVSPLRSSTALRILLLLLSLVSLSCFGAEQQPLPPMPSGSLGVAIFRMLGSLAFVVALFFAGAWLFRNMHRFRQPGAPQRKLQVLEAKTLGARQAIYVVAFEQQRMLIGSSAQGLTLLAHLPDGAPRCENVQSIVPVSFGEALMQALGRK